MKYVSYVFDQILTVTFSVVSSKEIFFHASQARLHQFRVIDLFCVEGSKKRSDRWNSSKDLEEFFIKRTGRASIYRHFRLCAN